MLHYLSTFSCCLFAWAIVICSIWNVIRNTRHGINHVKRLHQIPCHRCLYFTNDYNLKCTVQPTIACTEDAISCRDFEPSVRRPAPACSGCQTRACHLNLTTELVFQTGAEIDPSAKILNESEAMR